MPESGTDTKAAGDTAAADAENKGAPAAPATGTAPGDNAQSQDAGNTGDAAKAGDGNLPKGAKIEFFKLREGKRKAGEERDALARENETLKKLLSEREAATDKTANGKTTSFLDDPDGWISAKEKEIEGRILGALDERNNQERLTRDSGVAERWLLTRSHLKDPAFVEDVKTVIESDPDIRGVAAVSPRTAAKAAYLAVCEARGVAPDLSGVKDAAATAAAAARGNGAALSAPGSGGQRTWSGGEANAYLDAVSPGSQVWKERLAEVKKAQSEGRIK